MGQTHSSTGHDIPMSVADLLGRYLERQIVAHRDGLGYAEPAGEAMAHDLAPLQPIDPRLALEDAVSAAVALSNTPCNPTVPAGWPTLVNHVDAVDLAYSLGNFPQLVRDLQVLLTGNPISPRHEAREALEVPELLAWAGTTVKESDRLFAAGVMRLARHFDVAEGLLAQPVNGSLHLLHANEVAALAWHRGQTEKAQKRWLKMPESPVVLFNRGMAALFLGDRKLARPALEQAFARLPDSSAWHHLAGVYLTLAGGA